MLRSFLSYRRDDENGKVLAHMMFRELGARYGEHSVFMDVDTGKHGLPFADELDKALNRSDAVFVIIGTDWLAELNRRLGSERDWVRFEVAQALRRPGLRVIPVRHPEARLPKSSDLPEDMRELAARHAATLDPFENFDGHISRLLGSLERDVAEERRASPLPPPGAGRPAAREPSRPSDKTEEPADAWFQAFAAVKPQPVVKSPAPLQGPARPPKASPEPFEVAMFETHMPYSTVNYSDLALLVFRDGHVCVYVVDLPVDKDDTKRPRVRLTAKQFASQTVLRTLPGGDPVALVVHFQRRAGLLGNRQVADQVALAFSPITQIGFNGPGDTETWAHRARTPGNDTDKVQKMREWLQAHGIPHWRPEARQDPTFESA